SPKPSPPCSPSTMPTSSHATMSASPKWPSITATCACSCSAAPATAKARRCWATSSGRRGRGLSADFRRWTQMSEQLLSLSDDEGLVLFDLLSRLIEDEKASRLIGSVQHDAEIWALNNLYCALERTQAVPFTPDYRSSVEGAR